MSIQDAINAVEDVLNFMGLDHSALDDIILIVLLFVIAFMSRIWYKLSISCNGITCEKAKSAIDKIVSIEDKVVDIEKIAIEMRADAKNSNQHVKDEVSDIDNKIGDLKMSMAELHGILVGASVASENVRRSIIHDDE